MSDDIKKYRAIIQESFQAQQPQQASTNPMVQRTAKRILESVGKQAITSDSLFGHVINNLPHREAGAPIDNKFVSAVLSEMQNQRKNRL